MLRSRCWSPSAAHPTRLHRMLAVGVSVTLLAGLAACSSDSGDDGTATDTATPATDTQVEETTAPGSDAADETTEPEADETTAGPLTFVDDRGETLTFDEPPTRVVAWQAIVPALVDLGIQPVGIIAFNDIATNPALIDAGADTEAMVPISTSYGEVDLEALAALDPDMIVTYTYGGEFLQGFTDANTEELAGEIAPFVAFDANAPVLDGIERTEELAVLLGADLDSAENRADAAAFDTAVADLEALVADKPGLTAAFGGPAPIGLFIAPIDSYPELQFYVEHGLDVFDGPEDSVVSWELVETVGADVFLIDDRTTEAELAETEGQPIWSVIPAVAAGQYSPTWRFLLSYSRADYARTINRMLPTMQAADPDVV